MQINLEFLREAARRGNKSRQFALSDLKRVSKFKKLRKRLEHHILLLGEYCTLLRDMDVIGIEVMCHYIENMNVANMFRKRKYSQPITLQKVKVRFINDKLHLIFTKGLHNELDKFVSGFIESCKTMPDRKEEYRVLDYVRANNSVIYGVVSPDIFYVDKNLKEVGGFDKMDSIVDVAGDLVLDLRVTGAIKVLFLVRGIRESF
jgi:hypothetical protein